MIILLYVWKVLMQYREYRNVICYNNTSYKEEDVENRFAN